MCRCKRACRKPTSCLCTDNLMVNSELTRLVRLSERSHCAHKTFTNVWPEIILITLLSTHTHTHTIHSTVARLHNDVCSNSAADGAHLNFSFNVYLLCLCASVCLCAQSVRIFEIVANRECHTFVNMPSAGDRIWHTHAKSANIIGVCDQLEFSPSHKPAQSECIDRIIRAVIRWTSSVIN